MKIDIFTHVAPTRFIQALDDMVSTNYYQKDALKAAEALYDLELRFRMMDKYDDLLQILVPSSPIEAIAGPEKAVRLAKICNDAIAELVFKYPDRFIAGVACLPMNDVEASLDEIDRAINDLRFRGIQLWTPVNDVPIDSPQFLPIYEKMAQYNLPIFLHPMRPADFADYRSENVSKYRIYNLFGWPYETAVAMTRLVFSGILEKYPGLKVITHHCGSMVPYFAERIKGHYDVMEMQRGENFKRGLTRAPIEYYQMFYNDTAIYGNTPALMLAHAFFGPDKLLFGTDLPFGPQFGDRYVRQTIQAIQEMEISDADKKRIFEDNAKKLMRLPI